MYFIELFIDYFFLIVQNRAWVISIVKHFKLDAARPWRTCRNLNGSKNLNLLQLKFHHNTRVDCQTTKSQIPDKTCKLYSEGLSFLGSYAFFSKLLYCIQFSWI